MSILVNFMHFQRANTNLHLQSFGFVGHMNGAAFCFFFFRKRREPAVAHIIIIGQFVVAIEMQIKILTEWVKTLRIEYGICKFDKKNSE